MTPSFIRVAPLAGVLALFLAGCSFNFNAGLIASPGTLEAEISSRFVEETGSPVIPDVDCGSEQLKIEVEATFGCDLTLAGDPTVYDVEVTITSVDGTDFEFTFFLPGYAPGLFATTEEVESVVAARFVEITGSPVVPDVDCGTQDLRLEIGATFACNATLDGDPGIYDVDVTITGIDGTNFTFRFFAPELGIGLFVAPEVVEQELVAQIMNATGASVPPVVDCGSEEFGVDVGSTFVCALTLDGDPNVYDVEVAITAIEGVQFEFSFFVPPEPRS